MPPPPPSEVVPPSAPPPPSEVVPPSAPPPPSEVPPTTPPPPSEVPPSAPPPSEVPPSQVPPSAPPPPSEVPPSEVPPSAPPPPSEVPPGNGETPPTSEFPFDYEFQSPGLGSALAVEDVDNKDLVRNGPRRFLPPGLQLGPDGAPRPGEILIDDLVPGPGGEIVLAGADDGLASQEIAPSSTSEGTQRRRVRLDGPSASGGNRNLFSFRGGN